MWFKISTFGDFTMGAKHVYHTMKLIQTQPEDVQVIAMRVVQHNAYFAHPENLLCTMLTDDDVGVRKEAVEKVLAIRASKINKPRSRIARGIRFFKPPPLKWDNTSYTNMIDWSAKEVTMTEPPVIRTFTDDEIKSALTSPLSLPGYPCHTTSVERCVKLVTEASMQVYGEEARHGLILSRVEAREQRASYDTKKDYYVKI